MSENMVERVSEAMEAAALEYGRLIKSGDQARTLTTVMAIAAIKAMREPTEHMLDKGSEVGWECVEFSLEPGEGIDGYNMEPAWYAMIDAALPTPEKDKDDGR